MALLVVYVLLIVVVAVEAAYREGFTIGRQPRPTEGPAAAASDTGAPADLKPIYLEAWIANRMEFDRSLLGLSAGAVGLIVTLVTTVGIRGSWQIAFTGASCLSFLTTLLCVLAIFRSNAELLRQMFTGADAKDRKPLFLDRAASTSFYLGVVLLALAAAIRVYREIDMADEQKPVEQAVTSVPLTKSLHGLPQMVIESLHGLPSIVSQLPQAASPQASAPVVTPEATDKK